MGKRLFVVSTYYHALISCVKQLLSSARSDIVITGYIPEGQALATRVQASGIFRKVYYVGEISEYQPKNIIDRIFLLHRRNAAMIEGQLPFSFDDYNEINIFHDDIWAAHYLKDKKKPYRLIEDSLDCFKTISKSPFFYMLPKGRLKTAVKRAFGIGYVFLGQDSFTTEVEVNDADALEIASFAAHKIKVVPREAMFNALSESDKVALLRIFSVDMPEFNPEGSVILLTQPLLTDGVAKTEAEQYSIYQRIITENPFHGKKLIIKPHPRDNLDYSVIFPEAVILKKNMPAEILTYLIKEDFFAAVTYFSSSIYSIKAEKYISYADNDFIK